MNCAVKAGVTYFIAVFGLGFVLGTVRTLLVTPAVGALLATLIELPFMLLASWLICAQVVRRFRIPQGLRARLLMGTLAFTLLIAAEAALSVWGFGRTLQQQLADYRAPASILGLSAQVAFALIPWIQVRTGPMAMPDK